jgi:hypothetical protein
MLTIRIEILQTRLVERFTKILLHSQALQSSHLDALKSRLAAVETAFGDVNPSKDQDLFIEHNIRPFSAPSVWKFEPCAVHYDTASSLELCDPILLISGIQ